MSHAGEPCPYIVRHEKLRSCAAVNDALGFVHAVPSDTCERCLAGNTEARDAFQRTALLRAKRSGAAATPLTITALIRRHLSLSEAEDLLVKAAPVLGDALALQLADELEARGGSA